MNSKDSIEWKISLQPNFAIYKNQFWEYHRIKGSNNRLTVSLKNKEKSEIVLIRILDSNTISVISPDAQEYTLTRKKALVPNFHNYDTIGFGNINLQDKPALLTGFIEEYDPNLFNGTGSIVLYTAMNGYAIANAETTFTIDSSGRFEVSIRAFNPQIAYLTIDGSTFTQVIVSPGDTITVGFNKLLKTVTADNNKWKGIYDWDINHYMGKYGMLSEEINLLKQNLSGYDLTMSMMKMDNINNLPQLEYIRWRNKLYAEEKHELDSILVSLNCSMKARQYFNKDLDNELLSNLYRYQFNGVRLQNIGPIYTSQIPESDFTVANMLNNNYISYINYLSFYEKQNPLSLSNNAVIKYYLTYLSNNIKNPTHHQMILNLLEKPAPSEEDFRYHSNEDSDDYDTFINRKISEMNSEYHKIIGLYSDQIPDSVARKGFLYGLDFTMQKYDYNLLSQLYAAYSIQMYLKNQSLGAEGKEWILKNINEPVVKKVMLENLERKNIIESTFFNYEQNTQFLDHITVTDNPQAFFDTLISQFKGKVIYIDFWADWCSPCREGFKSMKKLKQVYADKDVVFLYLGYKCNKENWKKAILQEQLSGYHYWLNNEQSDLMREKFSVIGIPRYLMVDKSGVVISKDVPTPENKAALTSLIENLLGSN